MQELEKLYTVEEIAAMLSVTTRTIRNYLRDGILQGKKLGGQWRFCKTDLEKFMDRGEMVSEMEREQIQMMQDFMNRKTEEADGTVCTCTVADLYISQEAARKKSDELCTLINTQQDIGVLQYKYSYQKARGKARFLLFAPPQLLIQLLEIINRP